MSQDEAITTLGQSWRVQLTYFTGTGKYYSEGSYSSSKPELYEIWDEVRAKIADGKRPGLVDGNDQFFVLIVVPEHPNNHPRLLVPNRL